MNEETVQSTPEEVQTGEAGELIDDGSDWSTSSTIVEVVDLDRPFMTTSFEDYTVVEGLLLLILVLAVVMICVKMIKGGFYWL